MVRRLYNLQDIYDFLKDYYNLEWRDFRILEQGCARPFKMTDFKKSQVSVPALLQSDECKDEICWLTISNRYFVVYGHGENNRNKTKTKLWQAYLAKKYTQEQNFCKTI